MWNQILPILIQGLQAKTNRLHIQIVLAKPTQTLTQEVVLESSLMLFAFIFTISKKMEFMQSEFTVHRRKSFTCSNYRNGWLYWKRSVFKITESFKTLLKADIIRTILVLFSLCLCCWHECMLFHFLEINRKPQGLFQLIFWETKNSTTLSHQQIGD